MEKCIILPIFPKKNTKIPKLTVNGEPIKVDQSAKYLGDIINSKGSKSDLVEDRVKRGTGCVVNILSIVQDVTFGIHTMETTLLLYNSIFLATVLYNSQSWSRFTKKESEKLRICQLSFLKRILQAPKSTPTSVVLCELGILPIESEIHSRKLMFLQHILKLDSTDPVRVVYSEQMKYKFEINWANEVNQIKELVNLNDEEQSIRQMSKSSWKSKVKKAINENALGKMNGDCEKLKKVNRQYTELKPQEYLLRLPITDARIAFAYRSGTLDIKCHKKWKYEDTLCRVCGESEEDLNHIINACGGKTDCLDLESENLEVIKTILQRIKTFNIKIQD